MISCVLLSAGLSSRFGSPKALAKISGKTLIERLQKTLLGSFVDEVVIVLGAYAEQIQPFILNHKKVKVVYNKDYNLGQTSSFKAGVNEISSTSDGIMLYPVDYPFVGKDTLMYLIDSFRLFRNISHSVAF